MAKKACKLERSDMPGLVRLRCQGCGFYAAIDVSGLSDKEREKLVREHAQSHGQQRKSNPITDDQFEERIHKEGGATVARVKTEQLAKLAEQQAEEPEAAESRAAAPETAEEKQERRRARWREYYHSHKEQYKEWGKRWRERQRAQAASQKPEPTKPKSQGKASPPRDERGRYIKAS